MAVYTTGQLFATEPADEGSPSIAFQASWLWNSLAAGAQVYLFLAGMMLLAEVARAEGLFERIAHAALRVADGSVERLFALVFGICVLVTVFLSNDATAVALTPAVAATAARARIAPLPFLYACAFVANAASFVLPISNPANLVIYGARLPALAPWLAEYALPSLVAVVSTYVMLRLHSLGALRGARLDAVTEPAPRIRTRALVAVPAAVAVMVAASLYGLPIGTYTACAALVAFAVTLTGASGATARVILRIDAPILLLVAVLFVAVGLVDRTNALADLRAFFATCLALGSPWGDVAGGFGVALLSNVVNNLPAGLGSRFALESMHEHVRFVQAVAIGIDLGPNLSITGSLATLFWLGTLRREGIKMSVWRFIGAGMVVMPVALLSTLLVLTKH